MTESHSQLKIPDFADRDVFSHQPTFGLGNRVYRLGWAICWLLLARWTPPIAHRWRINLANAFGAKVHATASLYSSVSIWYPRNLHMAEKSTLGPGVTCYCVAEVHLAPYAIVSQGAHLCTATHDLTNPAFQLIAKPIRIGAHAWVAAEAFVGPGVSVGEGAVLGARGVAFSDLEPWSVHAGNPARLIRPRPCFTRPLASGAGERHEA